MANCEFTVRLTSDAEPGTGLGGEVVNELVPRDYQGRPSLPATHIKGLMRAELAEIVRARDLDKTLVTRVFGGHGLAEDECNWGSMLPSSSHRPSPATPLPLVL